MGECTLGRMSNPLEDEDEQDLQQALAATKSAQDALLKRRRSSAAATSTIISKTLKSTSLSVASSMSGDFDDTDFDVPSVTLPTLEDILAEKENDDFMADIDAIVAGTVSDDTPTELNRQDSAMPNSAPTMSHSKARTTSVHGSVLRYNRLKSLAAHLHSASSRVSSNANISPVPTGLPS